MFSSGSQLTTANTGWTVIRDVVIITDQASSDNDQIIRASTVAQQLLRAGPESELWEEEEATLGDHGIGFRKEKRN